jgi:membrane protein DedA with SNARE-associated domain
MLAAAGFLRHGRGAGLQLVAVALGLAVLTGALLVHTLGVRFERDLARLVLEGRLEVLESARWNRPTTTRTS